MKHGLRNKLDRIKVELASYQKVLIALSGGVDSCLAAYLARTFLGKENAVAVISNSESLKQKDFDIATEFCKKFDIEFEIIKEGSGTRRQGPAPFTDSCIAT
ncbi:MAG: hypothetical protein K9K88_09835 [Desulfobacterales bacterium]|nr:hypothetical protein [Desulfobacterales bacterium]